MEIHDLDLVCAAIDQRKEFLHFISEEIWKTPELAFKEKNAHSLLTDACDKLGFKTTRHYKLDTAFMAEYSTQPGGPTIAVLLEYDALPGIGHACGHNLIAEAGLAAGVAIKHVMDKDTTIKGKIILLGCPAEEGGGGKIALVNSGAFEGVDVALMVHPCCFNCFDASMLSNQRLTAEFKGKEAHASGSPWEGRNALDAAVASYQNIALFRQQMKPSSRVHVIITKGGTATNLIPAESTIEVSIRVASKEEQNRLMTSIIECIEAGARAANCKVTITDHKEQFYESLNVNKSLVKVFAKHAIKLGIIPKDLSNSVIPSGSTDMGNVSQVIPAIHPFYGIGTIWMNHSKEYTEAAGSPDAQKPTLDAAKAMALTVLELLRNPDTLLQEVKQEFMRSTSLENGK